MTFKKGDIPNPAGRTVGSRHKATLAAQVLMEGETDRLTRKCIDAALGGDSVALRLCLERIYPVRKGAPVRFNLPSIETAADVAGALGAVAQEMAAGELTPDEATSVAGVLEAKRRAIETADIDERLRKVEEAQAGK
jgi:hypothetical protein